MLDALSLPFVQRGMLEVVLLAVAAGVLGTWIVLRGLAFFAHAVGTAAFPGLVLADGLAFPALLGAFATAAVVAAAVAVLGARERGEHDGATALVLAGALAAGVLLASDVFGSQAGVEQLLFGSLLLTRDSDLVLSGAVSLAALAATLLAGPRWLAVGFDAGAARAQGLRPGAPDALLLALVALTAIAALAIVGALLATALLVVPAATTRLLCRRMAVWQLATVGLVIVEGTVGLWLSVQLNAPSGATVAVLSAATFALLAGARALAPRRRRLGALAAAGALLALAAGCGGGGGAPGDRVAVVATTTQLGDLARVVGGDAVQVHQVLRPNTDPHEYEPRPADIVATGRADLVLTSGDGLDRWMGRVLESAGGAPAVLDVGAGRPYALAGDGGDGARLDPHWWHDPRNVEYAVGRIRDALVRARPRARAAVERRAAAYVVRLRRLDAGIAACFARIAPDRRRLVTDHDAFGYFARRYGLRVVGAVIPSQTTQAQPSAGELSRLAATIRRERVRAVFPESSLNPRLARAIARETGASADHVLYGDTLGPAGSRGATYLGSEAANADEVVRGLTAGARGCRPGGA
jgi:ABC-type Zn uptake system ZnuABC Zn-binding protein ZnuA/ABC-type Mn2+/Zn2+ transport system permease subunit